MRHQKHRYRLERFSAARKSLLRNLAASLFEHERIVTTETKAKALKKVAEPLITLGKRGDLAARRRALQILPNNKVVHKLFAEIAPLYAERNGGYTRIMKLSCRQGDAAPMVVIELVGFTERQKAREEEAQAAKEAAEQPKGLRQRLKTKVNKAKKELAQQVDAAKEAAEANAQAEVKS